MRSIENIKDFLNNSGVKFLLINQVNDEIGIFYLGIIKYYADKHGIKINVEENSGTMLLKMIYSA